MGLTAQPSIATKVASPARCLWDVPEGWSLGQAATVPCAYATAYESLPSSTCIHSIGCLQAFFCMLLRRGLPRSPRAAGSCVDLITRL
jgi:hypothetical protein